MSKVTLQQRMKLFASMAAVALAVGAAPALAAPPDDLVAAAKKEGQLTVIALPRDWCGYGALIDSFKAKYGLAVNELNPDGGSGDEVEAIKANKDNKGPQAPDVIDVGLSFGPSAKADGLLLPYKVSTWDTIPDSAKDADGYWVGDYYGVLTFAVNADIVKTAPTDWADLLKPEYKAGVALAGDPRVSNQATTAVYAAGLGAGETDAAKAAAKGLDFFADLNKKGNFVPVIGKAASIAQGTHADPHLLGLQRAGGARLAEGQPEGRSRRAQDRRRRRRLRPGDQRLRAASQRRQAVARAPLFRRRADRLVEGLLPPDPFQQPRREQEGSRRRARRAAAGGRLRQGEVPDPRRAGGGQGRDRQAMGRGRRGHRRQVTPARSADRRPSPFAGVGGAGRVKADVRR